MCAVLELHGGVELLIGGDGGVVYGGIDCLSQRGVPWNASTGMPTTSPRKLTFQVLP